MIKSQFIIIGVLSLIAVVATTSTLSAYALLRGGDVVDLANSVASGKTPIVQSIADKANPLKDPAVKDFANKVSDSIPLDKILGSTSTKDLQSLQNPQDIVSSIPNMGLGQ